MENDVSIVDNQIFVFNVLDVLLDDDWPIRELYNLFNKRGKCISFAILQEILSFLHSEQCIRVRDAGMMKDSCGNPEYWEWYEITQKGRILHNTLFQKLFPNELINRQ